MNEGACSGDPLWVKVRTESGDEMRLMLDTGSDVSVLDTAWVRKLGHPVGRKHIGVSFQGISGDLPVYEAPRLFVGNTQLLAAPKVVACSLKELELPFDGILGMDSLRPYCIQLDFGARRIRFLDPDRVGIQDLGRAFPITKGPSAELAYLKADLFGQGEMLFALDTGLCEPFDFAVAPGIFHRLLEQNPDHRAFNALIGPVGTGSAASFAGLKVGGESYANMKLIEVKLTPRRVKGFVGLRFLTRHVATFNFPKRTLYLRCLSSGLLRDGTTTSPGRSLAGRVEDAQGQPLSGVTVCLCTRSLDIYNASLPPEHFPVDATLGCPADQDSFYFTRTESDGRFSFPAQRGKCILLGSTKSGYAIASGAAPPPVVLRLVPWARLEGVVMLGNKPAPTGITVTGGYDDARFFDGIDLRLHLTATTDENGRFVFERTFCGMTRLSRQGPPGANSSGKSVRTNVPAGKTTRVVIPVFGPTVVGRIELPAKLRGQGLYLEAAQLQPLRQLPRLTLPADFLNLAEADREAWLQQWASSPAVRGSLLPPVPQEEQRLVWFDQNAQPSFTLLDAPPGTHRISVMVFPCTKGRVDYDHRLAVIAYKLTIPSPGVLTLGTTTDVGELPAEPYGLDHAGQAAPDFAFRTLDGKEHTLSQFKGKVVLLDFWGTWCGACRSELPRMRALHAAFGNDPSFVMVGLSIRDNPAVLQQFIQKNHVGWVQAAMGDPSKAWCVRLYQVQGYPTFYLIGKDGRVIASGHWADDLWLLVEAALAADAPLKHKAAPNGAP
jgi:thiol-disulfide isomerase/thioredoxin